MNSIVLVGLLVMVIHFLHAGRKHATLPGTEESMTTTIEFITALFCQVDDQLAGLPKHPEAHLWPSEVVTLGLLHALKGVGNRPFSRWLTRDYRPLFPRLPERTRLIRLLRTHHDWTQVFLAAPTVLGVIDTYGVELIHPIRVDRNFKRYFATAATRTTQCERSSKAAHTACFLPISRSTFYLYTAHMSSIVGGNSWHFHSRPAVRGGSYGASGCHLRTSGSQPHGALPRDRGAPGDRSRLVS